jgi:hypothetical protein
MRPRMTQPGPNGNPPLPDAAMKAAQAMGKKGWQGFVESLSRRMEAGPKLRDEVGHESLAGPGA